ncbi:hypothetical protein KAU45_00410 [bacterium]|nr:hypothetical protein [bacterium]
MKLFNLGNGIEFGQRLFGFSVLAVIFIGILVLHVLGLLGEGLAIAGWTGLCGVACALEIVRGIQRAAQEKANSTVEIETRDAIGFKEDDA